MPTKSPPGTFEIWIRRIAKGQYGAQLIRASWQSGAVVDFQPPFADDELSLMRRRVEGRLRETEAGRMDFMEGVGEKLFQTLFRGEMLTALRCCRAALGRKLPLRMLLDFTQAPELAELPWEYLFDPEEREFILAGGSTTLVRRLGSGATGAAPAPKGPVRMAVVLPHSEEEIGEDEEWRQLEELLDPLERSRRLKLLRIDANSMATLLEQLKGASYHVLHLIRHGAPDKLFFQADEEEDSGKDVVLSRRLSALLKDQPDLRLIVLNSCEGARGDSETSIPAMAAELERRGIPAVVAMQFAIPSNLAVHFAVSFYAALAAAQTVDEALATCWRDLYSGSNHPGWGTPVLYASRSGQELFTKPRWWTVKRQIAAMAALLLLAVGWLAVDPSVGDRELRLYVAPFASDQRLGPQHEIVLAKLEAAVQHWPPQAGPPLRIVHSGCRADGEGSWEEGRAKFYQLQELEQAPGTPLSYGLIDGRCRTSDVLDIEPVQFRSDPEPSETDFADPFPAESRLAEWLLKGSGVELTPELQRIIRAAVSRQAGHWVVQGVSRLAEGSYVEARRCFTEAIGKDPDLAAAYSYLALAESAMGLVSSALGHARHAVELEPRNGLLRFNYGSLLRRFKPEQVIEAVSQLTAAQDCKYPDAWNELGHIYLSAENWAKARGVLLQGLSVKPGDPMMRKNLARAELELGNPDAAAHHLQGIEGDIGHDFGLNLEIAYLKVRIEVAQNQLGEACIRLKLLKDADAGAGSTWWEEGQELAREVDCEARLSELSPRSDRIEQESTTH